ncbi:MAG: alpha/beta hydrolase [Deltaproteobacteria bacterium]|nr:alpha/beta hydrolase [Deltaproteobacteria bacterium]
MGLRDRNFERIETNGIRLRTVVEGEGPLVILLHGFPQCWYLWRHQIDPLVAAGWTVAAPDQRGYGGSDCPPNVEDYGILDLAADIDGLATTLGHDDYALMTHDWGAIAGHHVALLYPDRVRALVTLSVPYNRDPSWAAMCRQELHGENFFYWAHFQQPGVVEAELERDLRRNLRAMIWGGSGDGPEPEPGRAPKSKDSLFLEPMNEPPERLPAWISEQDIDYYVEQFARSGFQGPVDWYRNIPRLHALTPQLEGVKIKPPTCFMQGTRDAVRHFISSEGLADRHADLRAMIDIEGAGHWLPMEAADIVTGRAIRFLSEFR